MIGVSDNALELLKELIRTQMNNITDNVATGSCTDFADYAHQTGIIKGLALAERELLDLLERIDNA